MAVSAAMYSTFRTAVLPPAMVLRPRMRPESRLIGATPTRAASWWRPMVPTSGDREKLERAIAARERQRNLAGAHLKWMFATEKARTKVGRAYPRPAAT